VRVATPDSSRKQAIDNAALERPLLLMAHRSFRVLVLAGWRRTVVLVLSARS